MFVIVTNVCVMLGILSATSCFVTVMAACSGRANKNIEEIPKLPSNWPCEWNNGRIPFVFDYYSVNLKRLIGMVHKGLKYLESYACLTFREMNPVRMAHGYNVTYLYFTYSAVLEECCAPFFDDRAKRRVVLITPICRNRAEVAHATLHALGVSHGRSRGASFARDPVDAVMFPDDCSTKIGYDYGCCWNYLNFGAHWACSLTLMAFTLYRVYGSASSILRQTRPSSIQ